jgi:hypothetical protein
MPRYFFHGDDRGVRFEDDEGQVLPDREDARVHAIRGARSIIATAVLEGQLDLSGVIHVVDESGTAVVQIRFADVVMETCAGPSTPGPRKMARARLAAADRIIRDGETRVLRQRQLLAEIPLGHHHTIATKLLAQFETSLCHWRNYRNLIAIE